MAASKEGAGEYAAGQDDSIRGIAGRIVIGRREVSSRISRSGTEKSAPPQVSDTPGPQEAEMVPDAILRGDTLLPDSPGLGARVRAFGNEVMRRWEASLEIPAPEARRPFT